MPNGVIAELDPAPTTGDLPRHRPATRRLTRPSRPQPGRRVAPHPPITLQVEGLTVRLPGGGPLVLDDVTFTVRRGWLVGVLGPTGAGKTSLLAALTGRVPATAGTVRVAGRAAHVPQDDVLHGRLGLRRTLHHAATLRLPRGTAGSARRERIEGVLADLGLAAKAAAAIDTLSGGERKRANVAVELVGQPDVVLLDEPTSGLDPGHEQTVLGALRRVADAGRTVLAVTHGMAALPACDRVLVLGRGGRVAFFGPPAAAKAFFGSTDAATLFRDLDSVEGTARWAERFRAHPAHEQLVAGGSGELAEPADAGPPGPRRRTQLATLVHRAAELAAADRRRLALLALQGPILGLLLLGVLRPDGFSLDPLSPAGLQLGTVAMFLAVSATWLGAATAVREIVDELPIVRRERGAGLSLGAYVASKALVLGAIGGVEAAVLALIALLRQHPPAAGAVLPSGALEVVAAVALVAVAAVALGLCTSALVTTSEKALTVLPLVLVAQLVLAGPWAASASTPGLGALRSLAVARWGAAAVEATGRGDRDAWWAAVLWLVGLLAAALVGTWVLVRRRAGGAVPARRLRAADLVAGRTGRGAARRVLPVAGAAGVLIAVLGLSGGGAGSPPAQDGPLVAADTLPGAELGGAVVAPSTTAPTVPTVPTTTATAPRDGADVAPPVTEPAAPPQGGAAIAHLTPPPAAGPPPEPEPPAPPTVADPVPEAPATTEPPTTTTAPPPTTTTTARPSGGGTVTAATGGPWDWVWFWWDVARAYL